MVLGFRLIYPMLLVHSCPLVHLCLFIYMILNAMSRVKQAGAAKNADGILTDIFIEKGKNALTSIDRFFLKRNFECLSQYSVEEHLVCKKGTRNIMCTT